jgi:hypothetical protein
MIAFAVIGGLSTLSVACGRRSRGIILRPAAPSVRLPDSAPLHLTRRRIVNAARTIVKITRLLGGLGAGFAHDGHRGA